MSNTWNRSLRVLSLVLSTAVALTPVAQANALAVTNEGNLKGRVTIAETREPVSGVTVKVVDIDSAEVVATTTTSSNGSLSLVDLPVGTYHLSVTAPEGYVAAGAPLVTITTGAATNVDVALVQSPGPDWFDYALKETAASVDGSAIITGECELRIETDADTQFLGDLVSVEAIGQALGSGANVCLAYEGVQQDDGTFLATAIFAQTCTDDLARAYENESICVGGGDWSTAQILAGLLGAAGLALAIIKISEGGPGVEVVTQ